MVVGVASGDLRSRRTFGSRAILSEISKSRDKGEISHEVTEICARACPPPTLTRSPTSPLSDLLLLWWVLHASFVLPIDNFCSDEIATLDAMGQDEIAISVATGSERELALHRRRCGLFLLLHCVMSFSTNNSSTRAFFPQRRWRSRTPDLRLLLWLRSRRSNGIRTHSLPPHHDLSHVFRLDGILTSRSPPRVAQ